MIEPDRLERQLDRLGARIVPADDAFERLERRLARRRRVRKTATVGLAFLVAIGGSSVAIVAFNGGAAPRRSTTTPSSWTPPTVPTLWPEDWADPSAPMLDAQAQGNADGDVPSTHWRTDPATVARRFVLQELGWEAVGKIVLTPLDQPPSRSEYIRFQASCGPSCGAGPATLYLTQPVRSGPGGIWSIGGVVDAHVHVGIGDTTSSTVGAAIATAVGSSVSVRMRMGQGFAGRGGFIATVGCTTARTSSPAIFPPGGRWDTTLPANPALQTSSPGNPCGPTAASYLFGYVKSGEGGAGSGQLFDPGNGIQYHLTAIPLLVRQPTSSTAAGPRPQTGGPPGLGLTLLVTLLLVGGLLGLSVMARRRVRPVPTHEGAGSGRPDGSR